MNRQDTSSHHDHAEHSHEGHEHAHHEHAQAARVAGQQGSAAKEANLGDGNFADDHAGHGHGARLAAPRRPTAATPGKEVEYTCPMHPQIRQMGPGTCPICGMALEPVVATA